MIDQGEGLEKSKIMSMQFLNDPLEILDISYFEHFKCYLNVTLNAGIPKCHAFYFLRGGKTRMKCEVRNIQGHFPDYSLICDKFDQY